jgi:hypothetical protein
MQAPPYNCFISLCVDLQYVTYLSQSGKKMGKNPRVFVNGLCIRSAFLIGLSFSIFGLVLFYIGNSYSYWQNFLLTSLYLPCTALKQILFIPVNVRSKYIECIYCMLSSYCSVTVYMFCSEYMCREGGMGSMNNAGQLLGYKENITHYNTLS